MNNRREKAKQIETRICEYKNPLSAWLQTCGCEFWFLFMSNGRCFQSSLFPCGPVLSPQNGSNRDQKPLSKGNTIMHRSTKTDSCLVMQSMIEFGLLLTRSLSASFFPNQSAKIRTGVCLASQISTGKHISCFSKWLQSIYRKEFNCVTNAHTHNSCTTKPGNFTVNFILAFLLVPAKKTFHRFDNKKLINSLLFLLALFGFDKKWFRFIWTTLLTWAQNFKGKPIAIEFDLNQ